MNIYGIKEYSLGETSGISYNIYLSGCKGWCGESCHSQHTWPFDSGVYLDIPKLIESMEDYGEYKFDHICIVGGEPLDQPIEELEEFLIILKEKFPKKELWLYTHFEISEVPDRVLNKLNYIKTGKYEKDLDEAEAQYGVFLVSNNQKIHKLD